MMRFDYMFRLAVAGVFVIPASAELEEGLGQSLLKVREAVEEIAGITERLENGNRSAIADLLALTEAPRESIGVANTDPVDDIRREVSRLREELETRVAREASAAPIETPPVDTVQFGPEPKPDSPTLDAHTPSPTTRPTVELTVKPKVIPAVKPNVEEPESPVHQVGPNSFEVDGYSASRLRHGRACYMAKRYELGIEVLASLSGSPEARYWRARCNEELGHNVKALELYHSIVEEGIPEMLAIQAQRDINFIEWETQIGPRIAARSAGNEGGQ